MARCISCVRARQAVYQARPEIRETARKRAAEWREDPDNRARGHALAKEWREQNPERVQALNEKHYKIHYAKFKDRYRRNTEKWRAENPERQRELNRSAYHKDLEKSRAKNRRAMKRQREIPAQKLRMYLSNQLYRRLKKREFHRTKLEWLPYTVAELAAHLENKFVPGMTWENYGNWHIDHIRPVSSFSFETPDDPEFKQCWALDNLQPLWATDNLRKHKKWKRDA